MRTLLRPSDTATRAILAPRRVMRWVFTGRIALAAAIFVAAVYEWRRADTGDTLIASLAFAAAMVFTAGSVMYRDVRRRPLGRGFYLLQTVFDLLLVTAAVHVTGGSMSQFAALYILVIAAASLLLPAGGSLIVAAIGNLLYFADVIWGHGTSLTLSVGLQLAVFAAVALTSGVLAARIQQVGAGTEELAAELVKVRLEAADILRNIRSGIITIDSDGNLLYANPAAGELLGLDLEHEVGSRVIETLAGAAPELAHVLRRGARDGVRTTRAEGTITAAGRSFPIGVTTTCSAATGPLGATATAIFSDIGDHKRLEALHLRTERLEAVAELSASLAHEIKNPLASIRSAVEQLGRMASAGDDERTLSTLIVREADRLSRLLSEFLDFARVRVTQVKPLDLAAVARGAMSLVAAHPDCRERVRLECTTPEHPLLIDGDEDLLHRVAFNLVLNAVQATPADGRVLLEVLPAPDDRLPDGLFAEKDVVALRVIDNGPGLSAEIRHRMFDPFFTTRPGGSGLGLAVVHRAVEAHRGIVLVDSNGDGTRFTVLLPRSQSASDASSPQVHP